MVALVAVGPILPKLGSAWHLHGAGSAPDSTAAALLRPSVPRSLVVTVAWGSCEHLGMALVPLPSSAPPRSATIPWG